MQGKRVSLPLGDTGAPCQPWVTTEEVQGRSSSQRLTARRADSASRQSFTPAPLSPAPCQGAGGLLQTTSVPGPRPAGLDGDPLVMFPAPLSTLARGFSWWRWDRYGSTRL